MTRRAAAPRAGDTDGLDRAVTFLPSIAAGVRSAVPRVRAVGAADEDYPCRWAVLGWLPGAPAEPGQVLGRSWLASGGGSVPWMM